MEDLSYPCLFPGLISGCRIRPGGLGDRLQCRHPYRRLVQRQGDRFQAGVNFKQQRPHRIVIGMRRVHQVSIRMNGPTVITPGCLRVPVIHRFTAFQISYLFNHFQHFYNPHLLLIIRAWQAGLQEIHGLALAG